MKEETMKINESEKISEEEKRKNSDEFNMMQKNSLADSTVPLLNRSIISKLNRIYETLDEIQEIWIVNENKKLMNELGEAMGHIDNALDIIKNRDKPKNGK